MRYRRRCSPQAVGLDSAAKWDHTFAGKQNERESDGSE